MEYQTPTIIGHIDFVLADGIYALLATTGYNVT